MPSLRRHRPILSLLACLASVLLSLAPTVGRLHQALGVEAGDADWTAICTVEGLKHVSGDRFAAFLEQAAKTSDADGAPIAHHGEDCVYCTLLAATRVPSPIHLTLASIDASAYLSPLRPQWPRRERRNAVAHGPRGPPPFFADV
jgi:Protein of unknown function (DUF2946)